MTIDQNVSSSGNEYNYILYFVDQWSFINSKDAEYCTSLCRQVSGEKFPSSF